MPDQIVLVHCSDELLHVFHADDRGEPIPAGMLVPVCGADVVSMPRPRTSRDNVCDNCATWALQWARGNEPSA
jgi:hypothetical protein